MARYIALFALLGSACTGGPPGQSPTEDVLLDGADAGVESTSTVRCMNESGEIFVAWSDDRDGQFDIWANRSLDAGKVWLPAPVKVSRGDGDAVAPAIACDREGVWIAWEDTRDGELDNKNIYVNRSVGNDIGEEYEEEDHRISLDEDGYTMSRAPQIVVSDANVHVTWFDNINGAFDIFVATSGDSGDEWDEPVRVDTDPAGEAYSAFPRITANDGNVYVIWEDSRDGKSDVYFSRSTNEGSTFLAEDERLDLGEAAGKSGSYSPKLAADGETLYVVWHDERNSSVEDAPGGARDVFLNYSTDGGDDWLDDPVRMDTDNVGFFDSLYPNVLVEGDTAYVAWSDQGKAGGGYDIYFRKVVDGKPVGTDMLRVNTENEGFFNHTNVQMAMGVTNLVLAWQDYRNDATGQGYNDLYYNYTADRGDTWQTADLRIDSMEPGAAYKQDLSVSLYDGNLLSTWTDGRTGTSDVMFSSLLVGTASNYVPAAERK
jgi:hypothetical protein